MCIKAYPLIFSKKLQQLIDENNRYQGTGGASDGNRDYNFIPAFLDFESGGVYISSFSNGLPQDLIVSHNSINKVVKIKQLVVLGFVFENQFYTREQAMNTIARINKKH